MEPLVVAAVGLLALAGGAVLGFIARGLFPSRAMKEADEKSALIIEKARSQQKDLILDAKDGFSQQRLFEGAWKELYPGMIERIALSQGGRATSVDPATNTIVTDFGNYTGQVASVIPPHT